jgi:hypothetical protein
MMGPVSVPMIKAERSGRIKIAHRNGRYEIIAFPATVSIAIINSDIEASGKTSIAALLINQIPDNMRGYLLAIAFNVDFMVVPYVDKS